MLKVFTLVEPRKIQRIFNVLQLLDFVNICFSK